MPFLSVFFERGHVCDYKERFALLINQTSAYGFSRFTVRPFPDATEFGIRLNSLLAETKGNHGFFCVEGIYIV